MYVQKAQEERGGEQKTKFLDFVVKRKSLKRGWNGF